MKKIKELNSEDLPLYLGLTLIPNSSFKDIFQICNIVYDELGVLPNVAEMNYQAFVIPTEQELEELHRNVYMAVKEFFGKADFNFFPYISPELNALHLEKQSLLMGLGIDNSYGMTRNNLAESIEKVRARQLVNYPYSDCSKTTCPWFKGCRRVKWLWKREYPNIPSSERFTAHCSMKQAVNSAFALALYELEMEGKV